MGKAGKYNRVQQTPAGDTSKARERWFEEGLVALGKERFRSIAFPCEIGCGLAGGKWRRHAASLQRYRETTQVATTK
jgi:hypothetical protein